MKSAAWGHYNHVSIRFGRGCRLGALDFLDSKHCLVVTSSRGRQRLLNDPVIGASIKRNSDLIWVDSVDPNPDIRSLQSSIHGLSGARFEIVFGFGGGSVIDSAKVLALALGPAGRKFSLYDLFKNVAQLPHNAGLPLLVIPTTAGTGSEVTPYATVWDHEKRRKLSLSGPAIYPCSALIDPDLTDTLPRDVTLNSGLDAINQAAESIWSREITPISEALAQRALRIGLNALPRLMSNLSDGVSRDDMAEASLLAGLAISQTRTSLCHAISYPLTAHFGIPHGLACAFTMPAVLRHNLTADDGRFRRLAAVFQDIGTQDVENLILKFDVFNDVLGVADVVRTAVGSAQELYRLVDEMFTPGRADNSIAAVDRESVLQILRHSWYR
jgi:phosphonate metabolism-associated iron-containing alcohol dehydrogenase